MFRSLTIVALIMVFISLLSVWFYPSMQDFMANNAAWNGIKRLEREFNAEIPQSLAVIPGISEQAEKKVLLVIPTLDFNAEDLFIIRNFINDGGTLLLMDDYGYANTILSYLGMHIR